MNSPRRLIVAVLLAALVLVAWPAVASLVVSYTLVPVTIAEMTSTVVRPGQNAGEIIAIGFFNVKDVGGTVREQVQIVLPLTGQARADFIAWTNARMVAGFNTQRGL